MSRQLSRGSAGEYQADEQAGVAQLRWRVSGRCPCSWRAPSLASIRQMSGQVSRGSAGEYQADEPAGVARLSWRDRKSTRLNSSHHGISYAVFCLKKKK